MSKQKIVHYEVKTDEGMILIDPQTNRVDREKTIVKLDETEKYKGQLHKLRPIFKVDETEEEETEDPTKGDDRMIKDAPRRRRRRRDK